MQETELEYCMFPSTNHPSVGNLWVSLLVTLVELPN